MLELLSLVRARDEAATRSLIERLHPLIVRIVRAHLPRGEHEDDLRQEVFLRLFRRLDDFDGRVPLEHWVSRIAVNACIDQLRRRRARPSVVWSDLSDEHQRVLAEGTPVECTPERDHLAAELMQRLLEQLDPGDAALIRWFELEEKSIAEVCALTGWNSGVVRIRAFRARRRLRKLYESFGRQTRRPRHE